MENNNKNTYCPDLWEMFTLDNKGNVFHCNHIKPAKLGNIYFDKLTDLINNPVTLKYRKLSLEGKLKCYKDCNWVNKNIKDNEIPNTIIINSDSLKRIHLHWGLPCNISCIMCKQRTRIATNKSILKAEQIIKNIDINNFNEVVLSGGEPLFIQECLKYMSFLERINKKYILLTNGLLIDDKTSYRLAKYAKKVIISINAATQATHEKVNRGSNFKKLTNNIRNLIKDRKRLQSSLEIIGRMTITIHALKDISIFIKDFTNLGFDKINFGYDKSTVPEYFKDNTLIFNRLKQDINNSLKMSDKKDRIDLSRLKQLNLI